MIEGIIHDQNSFPGEMFQLIDQNGQVKNETLLKELTHKQLLDFYEWMVKIRVADNRTNNLQRTGKMGTYASVYGQEACQVGAGLALEKQDWLVPTFRETGMMWCFGLDLEYPLLYWRGNEMGNYHPEDVNCLPIAIPVGSHLIHATGIAWANKLQKKSDSVVFCSFSDGATSEGDFHAALNFAGVLKTKNVFFCQNNGYAISTPTMLQTASKSIAQKAFAYGMKAIQVDGNDVAAVYLACKAALELNRKEDAPILVEAVTYRLGNHTTSDNPKLYREDSEVEEWAKKEPVLRLRKYLESQNLWDEAKEKELQAKCSEEVEAIVQKVLEMPKLNPENMFTMLYAETPPILEAQKQKFLTEK